MAQLSIMPPSFSSTVTGIFTGDVRWTLHGKEREKKEKNHLTNNRTILILPGLSRTHQGERKKAIVEFIVLGISPLIFLPAKGYIKTNPNLFSNIIITLAGVLFINLKIKILSRSP